MTKKEAKEQRRKAKKLARVLNELPAGRFIYNNSISVPGDGVMAVEISIDWNGKWYYASGAAKCNRIDPWSEGLGVDIATGRALLRIAYQILKEEQAQREQENQSLVKEVKELFEEFQSMLGVSIFEDKTSVLNQPASVPGPRTYRGDQMHYGYGVIKPEYVPSGLEVIKGEEDVQEQSTPSSPES